MSAKAASPSRRVTALRDTSRKEWRIQGPERIVDGKATGEYDELLFVQGEMSFFEKDEFLGLLGDALDNALDKGALDVAPGALAELAGYSADELRAGRVRPSGDLLRLITKLFRAVPDVLPDAYLLWLGVPPEQRDGVRPFLRQIDDDTGFGIWNHFIEHNFQVIVDFGRRWFEEMQAIQQRLRTETETAETTATSGS